ncbi:hypothetical protein [Clostridium weizhouense]|uniref:Uncharacterized protein n=1 Tax=Clostridium weizhouense TaxID=2859781 RepID=A0ABS7APW8_9CLOT|nr:hypothetical protein [Clostridium weizhouense]MBW6410717.1 hypothetical protein [Clostridium weizhouense]
MENNYNLKTYNNYYKSTKKSGCVSMRYNFKDDEDQTIIVVDNINEISGNYINTK